MRTIINTAAKFIHLLIASSRICIQPRMLNLSANSKCIYWCCLLFVHSQMRQHLHFPTSYLLHCDVMSVFLYILRCANIAAKGADVWWLLPEMVCLFWGKEMFKFCCRKHFFFLSFNRWAAEFWLWWEGGQYQGGGLLMLYQLAEGERQKRPRPIQRPQRNSSRMPSIPMCCVKVEQTESYERAFLMRATLNTDRQSSNRSVWCTLTSTDLHAFLCVFLQWESETKMLGLAKSLHTCRVVSTDCDLYFLLHSFRLFSTQ